MKTLVLAKDSQLINEFRNGNNQALEILIWRYKERLFSSILLLIKDRYLAEDIFHDTFTNIIDSIRNNSYDEGNRFLSYAMRIAHNICMDHFRKVKQAKVLRNGENQTLENLNFCNDKEKGVIFSGSDRLRQLLLMLPEDQRKVIVLRHFADLSFKEISEMTNCSTNTTVGKMNCGLTEMTKVIEEKAV